MHVHEADPMDTGNRLGSNIYCFFLATAEQPKSLDISFVDDHRGADTNLYRDYGIPALQLQLHPRELGARL